MHAVGPLRCRTGFACKTATLLDGLHSDNTESQEQREERGGMAGREGEPVVHPYAFHERQLYIRHVGCEPCERPRCIDDMLEELGSQRRESESRCRQHTVSNAAEKQQKHAQYIRKPLRHLCIIPKEYIARGRVMVA